MTSTSSGAPKLSVSGPTAGTTPRPVPGGPVSHQGPDLPPTTFGTPAPAQLQTTTTSSPHQCRDQPSPPACAGSTTTTTTVRPTSYGPWTDTVSGIHLTLTLENHGPLVAGQLLTFDLQVHLDEAVNNDWQWAGWGDGSTSPPDGWRSRDPNVPGDDMGKCEPAGSNLMFVYHRAYRAAGDWTFTVPYGGDVDCSQRGGHPAPQVRGTIHVGPGPWLHNGPMPPEVYWSGNQRSTQCPEGGSAVCVQEVSADFDGWVDQMSLDWGDGSPPYRQTLAPPPYCDPANSSNPGQRDAWPSGGLSSGPSMAHTYPAAGQYTITLSAHSEGCDGSEGQSVTYTVSVGAG